MDRRDEVKIERTISTSASKANTDRKNPINVAETLAPERDGQGHLPRALTIPPENIRQRVSQFRCDSADLRQRYQRTEVITTGDAALAATKVIMQPICSNDYRVKWVNAGTSYNSSLFGILDRN